MSRFVSILAISLLTMIHLFAPFLANAQEKKHKLFSDNDEQIRVTGKAMDENTFLRTKDGERYSSQYHPTKPVDIIIEFSEAPEFLQRKKGRPVTTSVSTLQLRLAELSRDLQNIQNSATKSLRQTPQALEIKRSFHKIFYGASATVSQAALSKIAALPYVKRVHFDHEVKAYLDQSVPLIRANEVWEELGTQGEDVIVGVIDTGIDYTHPDLGGGFGPQFKVIGGYDLVNNDQDPMDDHDHGTHVAGIIAADGDSIKGVAPAAKLMAFKVLDAFGQAASSVVIAGIERAMDPNNDGDFSDRVDIVNMSLGGEGTPNDAQSVAVDNAVALGTVFCISAGNSGSFYSIGSPGTALSAITVGASDKGDRIANFSSRGPNSAILTIKPDVVAPGVSITSTVRGGNYASFNGTSMSAPHVTGLTALLKSLHPDWTPGRIKAAIVNTAIDLGENVMVQGGGRIDALKAATAQSYIEPVQINFGFADEGQTSWNSTATLTVTNTSVSPQTFSVSTGSPRSGIELQVEPAAFDLDHGSSQDVEVSLTVDNDFVPYVNLDSGLSYDGLLSFLGTQDTLNVPWAFNKTHRLIVTSDMEVDDFFLTSHSPISVSHNDAPISTNPFTYQVLIPTGIYDLVAFQYEFGRIFFKEQLNIEGSDTVQIVEADMPNLIEFRGVDEGGHLLSMLPNESAGLNWTTQLTYNYNIRLLLKYPPTYAPLDVIATSLFYSDSLYISNVSNRFGIWPGETYHDLGGSNNIYTVQYEQLAGIDDNVRLSNDPSDYISQQIEIDIPLENPNVKIPGIEFLVAWHFGIPNPAFPDRGFAGMVGGRTLFEKGKWSGTLFHTPDHDAFRGLTAVIQGLVDTTFDAHAEPFLQTKIFRIVDGRLGSINDYRPAPSVYLSPNNGTMRFGKTPIFPLVEYDDLNGAEIAIWPDFYGSLNEWRVNDFLLTDYAFYDVLNDSLIQEGTFSDPRGTRTHIRSVFYLNDMPLSLYRFEMANKGYQVSNLQSTGKMTALFDTRRQDATPPTITSFKLLNSTGIPTNHLEIGEMATMEFSAADYGYDRAYNPIQPDSTRLYIKEWGAERWLRQELETILHDGPGRGHRPVGYYYRAHLQDHLAYGSTAVDLKIHLIDEHGNTSDWVLEPAFSIGDFVVNEDEPPPDPVPDHYALFPNYPNPFNPNTTIRYDIPEKTHVTLKIYNILGKVVNTLVEEVQEAGKKIITWDGTNRSGIKVASGVYVYSLTTKSFTRSRKLLLLR